jgi:hypothetical protein
MRNIVDRSGFDLFSVFSFRISDPLWGVSKFEFDFLYSALVD